MKILHLDTNHRLLIDQLDDLGCENVENYTASKSAIEKIIMDFDGIVIRSRFKIDKTTATIIAVVYESTCTPLSIFASTTTAIAFSKRRMMSFIISVLN